MVDANSIEHYLASRDLIARLADAAPRAGPNEGLWPGLTIYRFTEPTRPKWEEIRGLSIGLVAQGRKAVTVGGRRHVYDRSSYLAVGSHVLLRCEVVEASPREPCLCLTLHLQPDLVQHTSVQMFDTATEFASVEACAVRTLDGDLLGSVLRFLRCLSTEADRRVLGPLYLQEIAYRVLRREQFGRTLHVAARQPAASPVAAALRYVATHLAEPLTVTTLAGQVNLSPSAFSRIFRGVTGRSPYQYVKEARLNRGRELLLEGRLGVAEVSRAVGYSSTSHFIKEFRIRFGATPRDYATNRAAGAG